MKKICSLILFLLISCTLLQEQTRVITSTVTGSEDSKPVIGCTVQIKGTIKGITTDINGKYSLTVPHNANLPNLPRGVNYN